MMGLAMPAHILIRQSTDWRNGSPQARLNQYSAGRNRPEKPVHGVLACLGEQKENPPPVQPIGAALNEPLLLQYSDPAQRCGAGHSGTHAYTGNREMPLAEFRR